MSLSVSVNKKSRTEKLSSVRPDGSEENPQVMKIKLFSLLYLVSNDRLVDNVTQNIYFSRVMTPAPAISVLKYLGVTRKFNSTRDHSTPSLSTSSTSGLSRRTNLRSQKSSGLSSFTLKR